MIIVAAPGDPLQIHAGMLLGSGRSIKGWVGGSMAETLRFARRMKTMPMVETFPLEQAAQAYEAMMSAGVRFRAVLTMT